MEKLNTPLTQNLIADNLDFQIGFVHFNYDNNKDSPIGQQMIQELNRLTELSIEIKYSTDFSSKIFEVFENDYKNNSLYEEDGKTFTNKSIEKALDLYSDYKINAFIETTLKEHIESAKGMIEDGFNVKNAKSMLSLCELVEKEYKTNSDFKESVIKSRLSPELLLSELSVGSFVDFKRKFIPFSRDSKDNTIYTIELHHKDSNAKGEALNTPDHLKSINKMETNDKKETLTIQGNVGSVSELKGNDKKYVDISVAVNSPGEKADFKNVRIWEENNKDAGKIKKGDFVKLEGYEKNLKNSKDEDYTVFNVTKIAEHKPTEKLKITGNLGSDPDFKDVGGKPVATISIAVKDKSGNTEWKRIQMWEEKAEIAKGLKKGDTVTVEGKEGKEYTYKKGDETLTTKDIIASVIEKHEKKSKEDLNKELISYAQKGDWEKVAENLKKGGDAKTITEEHLKDLSPKEQDAVKNAIRSHEDLQNSEKKNSGVKM